MLPLRPLLPSKVNQQAPTVLSTGAVVVVVDVLEAVPSAGQGWQEGEKVEPDEVGITVKMTTVPCEVIPMAGFAVFPWLPVFEEGDDGWGQVDCDGSNCVAVRILCREK